MLSIRRITHLIAGVVCLCACGLTAAAVSSKNERMDIPRSISPNSGYRYYEIGDPRAPRPSATRFGLMLVGGGDWPYDALRWMVERAGHGRIVILRASDSTDNQFELFKNVGGLTAVQTLVFEDRRATSDRRVLKIIEQADGIFIAGGDQAHYVRYWKDTPLSAALDAHVRAGKPIGGTSAGLAILGAYAYGAMDGGSLASDDALNRPMGSSVTLVGDFLQLPHLERVIADSHFSDRKRLGRLIAFLARLSRQHKRNDLVGIGVDESTALCIDADGIGTVFTRNGGHVWLVQPGHHAETIATDRPLTFRGVRVTGLGSDSALSMDRFTVERPAFRYLYEVESGRLRRNDGRSSITPATSAPDGARAETQEDADTAKTGSG